MKYDIAKNEDGPLRRTLKSGVPVNAVSAPSTSKAGANGAVDDVPSASGYPALDERLQNIEKHLAIRYGECTDVFHHTGTHPCRQCRCLRDLY